VNQRGALVGLAVESPSGLPFVDDLARAAFWKAQPFPAPESIGQGDAAFRFGFLLVVTASSVNAPLADRGMLLGLVGRVGVETPGE
jgi:hypothetical protein